MWLPFEHSLTAELWTAELLNCWTAELLNCRAVELPDFSLSFLRKVQSRLEGRALSNAANRVQIMGGQLVSRFGSFWLSHSIGMCRMWRFLAILRSFFSSSLLCNFSCHPSPSSIFSTLSLLNLPSISWSTSQFCCSQIHTEYPFGNFIFFLSLYLPKSAYSI